MKALYRGHVATITDAMGNPSPTGDRLWDMDGAVLDAELWVSFADRDLIVDPTDAQVAAARERRPIPPDPDTEAEVRRLVSELLAAEGRA